jgi:cation diffusion facilitator CzcD-associated flavoprotein CzcO
VASVPGDDYTLDWLAGKFSPLSKEQAYTLLRTRNVLIQQGTYRAAILAPKLMKALLKRGVKTELKGSGIDVAHFVPDYNPWDQRICAVPDSDLFNALHSERAGVVTDQISHFTETGIMLESGKHLDADIIVTATGLKLQMLGGASLYIDGQPVKVGERMTYKAVLVEGVPNMAVMFGYINASWTLKVDLASQYVVRLLDYMQTHRYQIAMPQAESKNEKAQAQSDTVMGALSSGYVKRAQHELPKQGDIYPWRVTNNYLSDRIMLKHRKIKDDWLRFSR